MKFAQPVSVMIIVIAIFWWTNPTQAQQSNVTDSTVAANEMVSAATRFLSMLEPDQRKKANLQLEDQQREQWEFVPDPFCKQPRKGLSIKDMTAYQRALAEGIPATALSHRGYLQAKTVMALERLVFLKDGKDFREADNYYVTVYGKPERGGTWAWRFEGHHLSISVAVVDGKMFSVTPAFIGTNPANVTEGPMAGTEVLDEEQTLALELVNSLSSDQLKKAMIPGKPKIANDQGALEIATLNHSVADRAIVAYGGIEIANLKGEQQELLRKLTAVYANRFRREVVSGSNLGKVDESTPLSFAWYGGKKRGERHYYRIISDAFVIEFANSQNDANHAHAVWRDFDGDFGRDLLSEHFKNHKASQ